MSLDTTTPAWSATSSYPTRNRLEALPHWQRFAFGKVSLMTICLYARMRARIGALAAGVVLLTATSAFAGEYNLTVDRITIDAGDFTRSGIGYNGASPGPVLRFTEGEEVVINAVSYTHLTLPTILPV